MAETKSAIEVHCNSLNEQRMASTMNRRENFENFASAVSAGDGGRDVSHPNGSSALNAASSRSAQPEGLNANFRDISCNAGSGMYSKRILDTV